jgi:Domain of unknown function (DUF4189)
VAYSDITGMAWSWNHRSARAAKHAALAHCQGPQPRLWACATNITIAVARGPRGACACHWADPRLATHACTGALTRCQATYPPDDLDRHQVWLALVLDARHGVLYQHSPPNRLTPHQCRPTGLSQHPQASGGRGAAPGPPAPLRR